MAILIAVLMFGVLIFVHELGHFLVAVKVGVGVEEFSIGMGPRIFSRQGKLTRYTLRAFPIGGSCMMVGEDADVEDDRAFHKKSKLARLAVLVAGALMNILVGMLLLLIINACTPFFSSPTVNDVYLPGQTAFLPGDRIVSCDGYGVLNGMDARFAFSNIDRERFDAVVIRNGERVKLTDVPLVSTDAGWKVGITLGVEERTLGVVLRETGTQTLSYIRIVWKSLIYLVTGRVGIADLSGPVGVTAVMAETVQYGALSVLDLIALIAINLGVVNLLPLPALDGGRIFFILIEAVIGKPVPPEKEGVVHLVGFALLMLLTVFVFINDIIRVVT